MKPIERLALYFRQYNIRFSLVEKSIGIANGYLGKQVKNQSSIGSDILEKICRAYPNLNPTWLLTGNGPQQILDADVQRQSTTSNEDEATVQLSGTMQKEMDLYKLQVEGLVAQVDYLRREIKLQNEIIKMLKTGSDGQ